MKEKNINKKRLLACAAAAILLAITLFFFGIAISAEEYDGSATEAVTNNYEESSEEKAKEADFLDEIQKNADTPTDFSDESELAENKSSENTTEEKTGEIPESEYQNQESEDESLAEPIEGESQNQTDEDEGFAEPVEGESQNQTGEDEGFAEPIEGESQNQAGEEKRPAEIILSSDNIFEDIYKMLEANADKIFSILAFIGTIIVGVGYKSGLLPLLRDAVSKLKGSIDRVKEDNDTNNRTTGEKIKDITTAITEISQTLTKNTEEIARIEWQFESYEEMLREREAMRVLMENQIDMLYAIFMTSALPQYQKDEIGNKISQMREELSSYGVKEK